MAEPPHTPAHTFWPRRYRITAERRPKTHESMTIAHTFTGWAGDAAAAPAQLCVPVYRGCVANHLYMCIWTFACVACAASTQNTRIYMLTRRGRTWHVFGGGYGANGDSWIHGCCVCLSHMQPYMWTPISYTHEYGIRYTQVEARRRNIHVYVRWLPAWINRPTRTCVTDVQK